MPTLGRRRLIPRALELFEKQDYPNRELVIYDNGDNSIGDLIPRKRPWDAPTIRYFRRPEWRPRQPIGALRNITCDVASGELIAHWDDDDYSAPGRLTEQVKLLESARADLVGYNSMLFFDERTGKSFRYEADHETYAIGTSFLYRRAFWREHPFPTHDEQGAAMEHGEDNAFLRYVTSAELRTLPAADSLAMIARVHDNQTSEKLLRPSAYTEVSDGSILATVAARMKV